MSLLGDLLDLLVLRGVDPIYLTVTSYLVVVLDRRETSGLKIPFSFRPILRIFPV